MSGQVASHTSNRPNLQGTIDIPSRHLPSDLERPKGSSLEKKFSCSKSSIDYVIHSRMPMVTSLATLAAKAMSTQIVHFCTTVVTRVECTVLSLNLTAILRPSEVMGRTCNQAPAPGPLQPRAWP